MFACIKCTITGKARAAIRRATRDAVRKQYAGLGRQIVLRAFERAGKTFAEDKLKSALPRLARQSVEDVLAAVGRGEMFSGDVVRAVHPDFKPVPVADAAHSADLTEAGRERLTALAQGNQLRLSPAATGTDGFFIALFERAS